MDKEITKNMAKLYLVKDLFGHRKQMLLKIQLKHKIMLNSVQKLLRLLKF